MPTISSLDPAARDRLVARLKRIEGQARGICAMIDEDRDCTAVLDQIASIKAAINGLVPAYRPSGGLNSVGVASSLSYDWSPEWSTTVSVSYARLVGDAADSPIVKRFGSENQFTFGASVSYSFQTSGW